MSQCTLLLNSILSQELKNVHDSTEVAKPDTPTVDFTKETTHLYSTTSPPQRRITNGSATQTKRITPLVTGKPPTPPPKERSASPKSPVRGQSPVQKVNGIANKPKTNQEVIGFNKFFLLFEAQKSKIAHQYS